MAKAGEDYLNCPFNEEEYRVFYAALESAETVQAHEFENVKFFEACLPIEELGRRGYDTLRFGPMKPVGLVDPRTGRQPFAVVQLRAENLRFSSYNLVGFQNHLKFPEQKRIMRLIPGLGERGVPAPGANPSQHLHQLAPLAESRPELSQRAAGFCGGPTFRRRGLRGMHRDRPDGRPGPGGARYAEAWHGHPGYEHHGQDARATSRVGAGGAGPGPSPARPYVPPPRTTALGSLVHYITHASSTNYQPANISFDLLPPMEDLPRAIARDRRARREKQCQRALEDFENWRTGLTAFHTAGTEL